MKSDKGILFLTARSIDKIKSFKDGRSVVIYRQTGSATSEQANSPIYNASVYIMATAVKDSDGNIVDHARLMQLITADGSVSWAYSVKKPGVKEGEYTFKLKSGIGSWKNIIGTITETGYTAERADKHQTIGIEIAYDTAAEDDRSQYYDHANTYSNHDRGYSFHGAHVHEFTIPLKGDANIVINNQNGVIISENEDSPRHNATCCDRGFMIRKGEKTLGDVMLLEDTDVGGNIIWVYHEWWYGVGPGVYEIMAGHGKWSGIKGSGNSVSFVGNRQDEWFMPTWEMSWDI